MHFVLYSGELSVLIAATRSMKFTLIRTCLTPTGTSSCLSSSRFTVLMMRS